MSNRSQNLIRSTFIGVCLLMGLATGHASAADFKTLQTQTTLERLDHQLKDAPDNITTLGQRAWLQSGLKNHEQAVFDLSHILTLDPKNLWALSTRSWEYLALKKNDEALADANTALLLCSGNRTSYLLQRLNCLYMLGKDSEAANDCTEILNKCPAATQTDKLVAYSNRAEVLCRLGKYDESLADCAKAIAMDPRGCGGAAYYWRAQDLKALKDDAGAAAAMKKSKEIGYIDYGRAVVPTTTLVYESMFDSVQKRFSHRIDSQHFAFFFNTDEELASEIAKFSECFLSHVDTDLFKVKWDSPVNVYMMPDKESQHTFLKEQMHYDQDVWGTCIPERNALVFYTQSGFGTVAHIIFAQLGGDIQKGVDRFAGIDSFFEKIYGYQENDGSSALYWGYQNPWRLKKIEKEIPNLTLTDVIALSQDTKTDHQSEERLVAMFLFNTHHFKKYLDLALKGDRKGYGTLLEAVFDKPISAIEPEWHEYLVGVSKNLALLEENPNSQFFQSKNAFDNFVKENPSMFKDLERHLSINLNKDIEGSPAGEAPDQSDHSKKPGILPKGWIRAGSYPSEYEMGMDRGVTHGGAASGYIRSITTKLNGFGTLMQMFQADKFKGKKVRLTCWTKTESVRDWAGVWMRVDGPKGAAHFLSFDNMMDRPIKGTTDWAKREIVLDVPNEAVNIAFGVLLNGSGSVWVDDFELNEAGLSTSTTTPERSNQPSYINSEPTNLNFEDTK